MTSRRRSLLVLCLIAGSGIACTALVYLSALHQDDARIRSLMEFRAEWRASDLTWKLEGLGQSVLSVAATIAADPAISIERMRRIDARPMARQDSISGFAWLPRVPHDRRERFEAEARAAGIQGFRITEATAAGFVPAAPRTEYYPILHAWIFDGQPPGLGFDVLSDPGIRAAAAAARDSGGIAATPPLRSPITGRVTIVPVAPVYAGGDIPATLDERRSQLRGFVLGRAQLVRALDLALLDTPVPAGDIYLFAGAAEQIGGRGEPFAEFRRSGRAFVASGAPVDLAGLPGRVVIKPIGVLNGQWTAAFHFPPEALAAERWPGLWGLIVAGLLATAGAMAFFRREAMQTVRSERLVAERTADLRREADERMRAEQTASAILEQSPFAIVGLHPDRRVVLWNQAAERIFGYSSEEAIGAPYALVPPEGQAEFDRIIQRVSAGERLVDVEVRRRRKDGTLLDILFSGVPVYDSAGELSRLVFVLQDVTERKAIEAQLRQSQKMEAIGQLSGGIAHDFNNMLGAIIGNLEIALDEKRDVAAVHRLVETAIGIAERGGELVQRLLAFARRQMLDPRLIDAAAVVDGIVPILRRTLGEAIEIRSRCEPRIWPVLADPAQLDSALLNLAINARDAMPHGGTLTLSAENVTVDPELTLVYPDLTVGDYVVMGIADTGTGMPPDVLARAFEPFFTTKEAGRGTGLGLSMVYGFMRQSGGTAKIYSEPGHGTTVRLYLPRAAPAGAGEDAGPARDETVPGGRESVLVVEDNPDVRGVACAILGGLGYRVTPAGDAAEALRLIDAGQRFALLFSDVVMPGMSGIELAQEIRRRRPDMKILLTSGFASPVAVRDQAREVGFELLAKPYRRTALAVKVREVLDRGG